MKTPEEIFQELLFEQRGYTIIDKRTRLLITEAMKRFGLQCWLASTELPIVGEWSTETEYFNRYLQNLYLNQIAKQAQENGEQQCKHERSYFFHDNAPRYCPDCGKYIDGDKVI